MNKGLAWCETDRFIAGRRARFVEQRKAQRDLAWLRLYEKAIRTHAPRHEIPLADANHLTILAEQRLARLSSGDEQ